MLKLIERLRRAFPARCRDLLAALLAADPNHARRWASDPLAQPALQKMTERQLADLPFDPRSFSSQ